MLLRGNLEKKMIYRNRFIEKLFSVFLRNVKRHRVVVVQTDQDHRR